jgi:hypothetical protein
VVAGSREFFSGNRAPAVEFQLAAHFDDAGGVTRGQNAGETVWIEFEKVLVRTRSREESHLARYMPAFLPTTRGLLRLPTPVSDRRRQL